MPPPTTPLPDRMALHTAGQVTWPEPLLNRRCADCQHFDRRDIKTPGKGRCWLVRARHGTAGKAFIGTDTVACPQFKALLP